MKEVPYSELPPIWFEKLVLEKEKEKNKEMMENDEEKLVLVEEKDTALDNFKVMQPFGK